MIERIRELYIQAIHATKHDPVDDVNVQIAEKYAELIVEECATVIEKNLFQNIGYNTSRAVKRHFGMDDEE